MSQGWRGVSEDGVMSLSDPALIRPMSSGPEIAGGRRAAFAVGAGRVFVLVGRRCASNRTTRDRQRRACGSSPRLPAWCCVSVFVGHVRVSSSGEVWGRQGRDAYFPCWEGGGREAEVCSGEGGPWAFR